MNEDDFAKQLAAKLDEGLQEIPPEVLRGLAVARAAACEHVRIKKYGHAGYTMQGGNLVGWIRKHRLGTMGVLFVVLFAVGVVMWQSSISVPTDTADVDAALLTGDLPVNAYLDNHLNKWTNDDSQ